MGMGEMTPKFPPGTPEYEAYRTELRMELGKFAKGKPPYPYPVTESTRIPERGSMTIDIVPAAPCALHGCSAELLVNQGPYSFVRVHLDDEQRRALIEALGGTWPA
jgi:hypothetical protein